MQGLLFNVEQHGLHWHCVAPLTAKGAPQLEVFCKKATHKQSSPPGCGAPESSKSKRRITGFFPLSMCNMHHCDYVRHCMPFKNNRLTGPSQTYLAYTFS